MNFKSKGLIIAIITGLVLLFTFSYYFVGESGQQIDFNSQVKPILNKHCIHCHGGVKKSSNFSLMTRADVLKAGDSGHAAIIPGKPGQSELIKRLKTHDLDERMPYHEAQLHQREINMLTQWVKEGAKWDKHWAYVPVKEVAIPTLKLNGNASSNTKNWAKNDIDRFIMAKLNQIGLSPNEEAQKANLLRRVSLDLIGLPPSQNLASQFLSKTNPMTYDALVDSLLSSHSYGERWASTWLDLARYADSKGFERDTHRPIWQYRDWVINAFNINMPYDQFITEQLAGDLLPYPTDDQYIATGFHRNTTTNDEGGTVNEEFRIAAVLDRVNTTWEAILGTTFACVQCHGHPYDPINHDEYYRSVAFFNNTRDEDTYDDYPWLRNFSIRDKNDLKKLTTWSSAVSTKEKADEIATFLKTLQPTINTTEVDQFENAELYDTKFLVFRNNGSGRIKKVNLTGKRQIIYKYSTWLHNGVWSVHIDKKDGPRIAEINVKHTNGKAKIATANMIPTKGFHDIYLQYKNNQAKDPKQSTMRIEWLKFDEDFPGKGQPGYAENTKIYWDLLQKEMSHTLIMMENPTDRRRKTHVFDRGNWLVHGEEVQPGVPAIFNPLPESAPKNRLGLAKWITEKSNPLTARTMVNRIWQQIFGKGLVTTLEDLGTQGEPPSHPGLLDWLAWRYMHQHQWDTKALIKDIVSSATYRQSAKLTVDKIAKDPKNLYYASGPRNRLSAEQVRDQVLAVSQLLFDSLYGPPVMPYQPEGVWNTPYNATTWTISEGKNRYRRAIYTFWKRGSPYPALETFDMGSREVCVSRRVVTNTPLQALVTLNDPSHFKAAQHLALQMLAGGSSPVEQIKSGYKMTMFKPIAPDKLETLQKLYTNTLANFKNDRENTNALLEGLSETEQTPALASLVIVANAMMNLDEFLTK